MSPYQGLRTFFLFVYCLVSFFSVEKCLCDDKLNVTVSGQSETDAVDDYTKFTGDDELISDLVTAPIFEIDSETDPGSDIAKILKILEVAERQQAAATSTTTTSTTPTPIKNIPETTQEPSTGTASEDDDDDVKEAVAYLDTMIAYLNETVVKTYKENGLPLPENLDLSDLSDNDEDDDDLNNLQTLERRSSPHGHDKPPTLNGLLWKTTLALWDLTSPAFYRTLPGQKVKLVSDAVALPFRTYGAVRHKINDLVSDPLGRRLGFGWGHHHHGHHHHGWGHEFIDGPVYVAHEPENSLFKLWLRFLYRSIRPAIVAKIRLHVMTIRIRIRMILALVNFLRRVKILKFVATFKSLLAKVRLLRQRLTQQVVVLKETDHIHHHQGWGWEPPPPPPMTTTTQAPPPPTPGWGWGGWGSGWGSGGSGWGSGRTDTSGAVPVQSYGPPKPTTPIMGMSMDPMMAYGPPATPPPAMEPGSMYGPPPPMETSGSGALASSSSDAAASSAAFNYDFSNSPPSDYLVAPPDSSSNNEADLPSYTRYLREFGIDPLSLSEADKQKDLPYLVSPSPSSEDSASDNNKKEIFKRQTEQTEGIPIRRT